VKYGFRHRQEKQPTKRENNESISSSKELKVLSVGLEAFHVVITSFMAVLEKL
jgi:hypothetical protein